MSKTYNIYCDESCHLENDHMKYMVLGSVSSAFNQVRLHTENIKNLKKKHNYYGEIKWSNVSNSQKLFYLELIDYFFATDLRFRALVVEKDWIDNSRFGQEYDDFYYKMYYQMLNHNKNSEYHYNVYLDIKDTLSAFKVRKLKEILNVKFGVFRNVQNIHSSESLIMQLADLMIGAVSYNLNSENQNVKAKKSIIEKIKHHSKQNLGSSSYLKEEKLNIFFINLR